MDKNFYTYLHKKPCGEIFYVGKGKGKRAWDKQHRNHLWQDVVLQYGYVVEIIDNNISESQALECEQFLISEIGRLSTGGTLVNLTKGGEGTSGYSYTYTEEQRARRSGSGNGRYNKTVYSFTNIVTKEVFIGTCYNLALRVGRPVNSLICKNPILTVDGWRLTKNLHVKSTAGDKIIYRFRNTKSGELFVGTRRELKEVKGVNPIKLFSVGVYRCKSTRGWSLA